LLQLRGTVFKVIVNGSWIFPAALTAISEVKDSLDAIVLPRVLLPDTLVWSHTTNGKLSSKQAFCFLRPTSPLLPWADQIWSTSISLSHSFIFWRLHHGKMPTDENLKTRGCIIVSICSLCLNTDETSYHLFLHCNFAKHLWDWIGVKLHCVMDCSSVNSLLSCRPNSCSSQVSDIYLATVVHMLTLFCGKGIPCVSLQFRHLSIQPKYVFTLWLQCPEMSPKVSACLWTSLYLILLWFLIIAIESKK